MRAYLIAKLAAICAPFWWDKKPTLSGRSNYMMRAFLIWITRRVTTCRVTSRRLSMWRAGVFKALPQARFAIVAIVLFYVRYLLIAVNRIPLTTILILTLPTSPLTTISRLRVLIVG